MALAADVLAPCTECGARHAGIEARPATTAASCHVVLPTAPAIYVRCLECGHLGAARPLLDVVDGGFDERECELVLADWNASRSVKDWMLDLLAASPTRH
jgi:hypothetical protein